MRARLYARHEKDAEAEDDLNEDIKRNPRSLAALLMSAEVRARLEKFQAEHLEDAKLKEVEKWRKGMMDRLGLWSFGPGAKDDPEDEEAEADPEVAVDS